MICIQALSFSFEDLKRWYNRYYTSDGASLYSPWSIGNALSNGDLGSYWIESGTVIISFFAMLTLIPSLGYNRLVQNRIYHFLGTDDQYRAQISELVANRGTVVEIEDDMFVCHIHSLHLAVRVFNCVFSAADMSSTQLWTLTYYAGYLTKVINGSAGLVVHLSSNSDIDSATWYYRW